MSKNRKQRLSDESFKEVLLKELSKANHQADCKTHFYNHIKNNYAIAKSRALKLYDKYYTEIKINKVKKLENTQLAIEINNLKQALMLKVERQIAIQNDLQVINEKIKNNQVNETTTSHGQLIEFSRELTPSELAALVKAKKDLHAELSKMAGDYAKKEIEITNIGYINDNYIDE